MTQSILVLGAGSWGTALATVLSRRGHNVYLWGRDANVINDYQLKRENTRYLPGIKLAKNLNFIADITPILPKVEHILVVVPSHAFSQCLTWLKPQLNAQHKLCWATKGLEPESGLFLHEVAQQILGATQSLALLSGPSFANEVAKGMPSAVTIAATTLDYAKELQQLFHGPQFRIYTSLDLAGVAVGGAVKNVLAVAVGICDGLGGHGANAHAALVTRALVEMRRFGKILGANDETLTGLSGLGDLILTCGDNQSRNRRFGLALGQGLNAQQAQATIDQTIESITTAREVYQVSQRHHLTMPICEQIYLVLYDNKPAKQAVDDLLSRQPSLEF